MGSNAERTAGEWFAEALRWYLERHQGCACCQRQHCVFRSEWGRRIEFHCTECDFSTSCDGLTGMASYTPGAALDGRRPAVLLGSEELFELRCPPGLVH
jgi:hypothetical protein